MLLMIEGRQMTAETLAEIGTRYDFRIALAALLVHAGNVDGNFADVEKQSIRDLLVSQLGLPPIDARELMVLVNYRNLQAPEIDELVAALAHSLGAEGRVHFVEWLWEIVIADRIVTAEETGLIATLATRLGVAPRAQDAIAARFFRSTAA